MIVYLLLPKNNLSIITIPIKTFVLSITKWGQHRSTVFSFGRDQGEGEIKASS